MLSPQERGDRVSLLSLMTAGAPECGLPGGRRGASLSSRRLNLKNKFIILRSNSQRSKAMIDNTVGRDRVARMVTLMVALLLLPVLCQSAETGKEKITFAYAAFSPSMAGVWMAKELGAFERNGLNAEPIYISSGATAIQALGGGRVQAAFGG